MMNILLTNPQKIYISASIAAVILVILLTVIFVYKKWYAKKHYKEATYFILSKIAKENDYLLLNNYTINFDESHIGVIDHILISKKYIIVINDFPISGVVSGEMRDRSLRVVKSNKDIKNISNPLNYNINLIKRLNIYHRLDRELVKGLVVINNDSEIVMENSGDQFQMIRQKDLKKIIRRIDKVDVKNLKQGDVENFINKLYQENVLRRENENQWISRE